MKLPAPWIAIHPERIPVNLERAETPQLNGLATNLV
jgi:hypothetical protein